jgi:Fe-S cluster assembly protein SufD
VPDGVTIEPLVHALFLTTTKSASEHASEAGAPLAAYPRNVIALGRNAGLNLFIEYASLDPERGQASEAGRQAFLTNSVNTMALAEGAHLDATLLLDGGGPDYHLAATRARLAESATLNLTTVTVGDGTCRHAIGAQLLGERASVTLNGLDVLSDHGTAHHAIVMGHQAPNGVSDQFYKGILDDAAQSAFNGMVFVARGANGTDSRQLNKNLLLSGDARVWTRPQLQINADDVKCAHGATVGSLEPDQLFYLASRGLDRALAQSLLTFGFAGEIIERIGHPNVRKALGERVLKALPGTCASSLCAVPSGDY